MTNTVLQLFDAQVTGDLVPGDAADGSCTLRLTGIDAARFMVLAGIGSISPPVEIRVDLHAADIAYLQRITDKAPDEMIRVAHLAWSDDASGEPTTVSTFLLR
jgi:hypothetical protein